MEGDASSKLQKWGCHCEKPAFYLEGNRQSMKVWELKSNVFLIILDLEDNTDQDVTEGRKTG